MAIRCKDCTLPELLMEGRLTIPQYQREYKWMRTHWQDLFTDITAGRFVEEDSVDSYFIGAMIFIAPDDDGESPPNVVDGQQRLTTVCLWLAALKHALTQVLVPLANATKKLTQLVRKADTFTATWTPAKIANIADSSERALRISELTERTAQKPLATKWLQECSLLRARIKGSGDEASLISRIDDLLFDTVGGEAQGRLELGQQNSDRKTFRQLLDVVQADAKREEKAASGDRTAGQRDRRKAFEESYREIRATLLFKAFTFFRKQYSDGSLEHVVTAALAGRTQGELSTAGEDVQIEVPKRSDPTYLKVVVDCVAKHLELIERLQIARIRADDTRAAYILFEGLNYRSEPLSVLDLLKNHLLGRIDPVKKTPPDRERQRAYEEAYEQWNELVELLPSQSQAHFLRHVYLAFHKSSESEELFSDEKVDRLSEPKVLRKFMDATRDWRSARKMVAFLLERAKVYQHFIDPPSIFAIDTDVGKELDILAIASARPAGVLMVKLLHRFRSQPRELLGIIRVLQKFFIRRHLTDEPRTQDLEKLFVDLADEWSDGADINTFCIAAEEHLRKASYKATLEHVVREAAFCGDQQSLARALLILLEYRAAGTDKRPDLGKRFGGKAEYSLEHVYPQSPKEEWSATSSAVLRDELGIAEPSEQDLSALARYKAFLGNLTIAQLASNTGMSNQGFRVKKEYKQNEEPRGYLNGLWLNEDLAKWTDWSIAGVRERGVRLAVALARSLAFEGEKPVADSRVTELVKEALERGEPIAGDGELDCEDIDQAEDGAASANAEENK
jgi:hypothetical protein